ncbi:hypothetical protein C0Q70_12029 [Pomacea canaliculata]|uniref:Uncharacterized protein n=1 Tax=Pomacea canaliculata TaxID=400727 RepID=A0A2T7P0E2_POMCA|nr:hypothetical protein C0Q70_12029 [Pomacea canaliculata]
MCKGKSTGHITPCKSQNFSTRLLDVGHLIQQRWQEKPRRNWRPDTGKKADFLNELLLLRKIPKHLNIVTSILRMRCTDQTARVAPLSFRPCPHGDGNAPNGDLLTYLRGRRPKKSEPETERRTENGDNEKTTTITPPTLTSKNCLPFLCRSPEA